MLGFENGGIRTPAVSRLVALGIAVICSYGVVRAIFVTGDLPLLMPLIAVALSIVTLAKPNRRHRSELGFARIGFHVGLFAYFLSYPILLPESIDPTISTEVHRTIGIMLLLTILGFEAGYYLKKTRRSASPDPDQPFEIGERQRKWLWLCVCFGMTAWLLTVLDYAYAGGVSATDVLLTMRGSVEGARENAVTSLGHLAFLLGGGRFLAAAAAALLLASATSLSKFATCVCWLVLILCALLGFLGGSRAVFLYSFSPLVMTVWLRLSSLKGGRKLRWMLIGLAGVVLALTWGAMSAMRGGDIRNYEGGFEQINPVTYAQGAFDMYSQVAIIVETFPDKLDYEYGRSLIPLVVGWVPRTQWPGKPYPFSLFANTIRGETLEDRAASLAVGLPVEGYGNFGLLGVLLWGLLMGVACRVGDGYVGRLHPSNPLRLFLATTIAIWAAMIVRGGVPEMFYMGLNVAMFPLAMSWFLSRRSRSASRQVLPASVGGVLQPRHLSN